MIGFARGAVDDMPASTGSATGRALARRGLRSAVLETQRAVVHLAKLAGGLDGAIVNARRQGLAPEEITALLGAWGLPAGLEPGDSGPLLDGWIAALAACGEQVAADSGLVPSAEERV
jgi:hypothetical protein